MRKMFIGPMEFTPYRPWSEARRAAALVAARARILARHVLLAKPIPQTAPPPVPQPVLPAPRQLLALPAPVHNEWATPNVDEISPVRIGSRVSWTDEGLRALRSRASHVGNGTIERIHFWDEHEPTVAIRFSGSRIDVAYVTHLNVVEY